MTTTEHATPVSASAAWDQVTGLTVIDDDVHHGPSRRAERLRDGDGLELAARARRPALARDQQPEDGGHLSLYLTPKQLVLR